MFQPNAFVMIMLHDFYVVDASESYEVEEKTE